MENLNKKRKAELIDLVEHANYRVKELEEQKRYWITAYRNISNKYQNELYASEAYRTSRNYFKRSFYSMAVVTALIALLSAICGIIICDMTL